MKKISTKKVISVLLIIVLIMTSIPLTAFGTSISKNIWDGSTATSFSKGAGTREDPYIISNGSELSYFAKTVNSGVTYLGLYIALSNDIYLNDIVSYDKWTNNNSPNNIWTGMSGFVGTLDGRGCTIYGLYMSKSTNNTGFFNELGRGKRTTICNLNFEKAFVSGTSNVGIIVGNAGVTNLLGNTDYLIIENCSVGGKVIGTSDYVGGFVGTFSSGGNYGLTIIKSINRSSVFGNNYVGGFVGYAAIGNISGLNTSGNGKEWIRMNDCSNLGIINGRDYAGGIVGYASRNLNCSGLDLQRLSNKVKVSGSNNVGGISGLVTPSISSTTVTQCYNTGQVDGISSVGGIIGNIEADFSELTSLMNSYNVGNITGEAYVGGIVGSGKTDLQVSQCYSVGTVSASSGMSTNVCAIIGRAYGSAWGNVVVKNSYFLEGSAPNGTMGSATNVTSYTYAKMRQSGSYAQFDFDTVWGIDTSRNNGYPYLQSLENHYTDLIVVDKHKLYIFVYDVDSKKGVANASVSVGDIQFSTDKDGVVIFDSIEDIEQSLFVYKEGYNPYSDKTKFKFGELQAFGIKIDDGKPYIASAFLTKDNGYRSNIMFKVETFQEYSNETFDLTFFGMYKNGTIKKYELIQGGKKVKETDSSGRFVNLSVADFKATNDLMNDGSNSIYVRLTASDGTVSPLIKLYLAVEQARVSNTEFKFTLGKEHSITIPGWVPLVGGEKFQMNLDFIPIKFEIEDNKLKLCFGVKDFFKIEENYEKFKEMVDGIDKLGWSNYYKNSIKGLNETIKSQSGMTFLNDIEPEVDLFGYVEGVLDNGKLKVVNGKLALKFGIEGTTKYQMFAGPIPVAIETKLGAKVEISDLITLYDDKSNEWFKFKVPEIEFTLPHFGVKGGIGCAYIASVGVYGEVDFKSKVNFETFYSKYSLEGEFGGYAKALIFEYKWPAWDGVIWSDEHYANSVQPLLSQSYSLPVTDNMYDTKNYNISSRNYLYNQSSWLSNNGIMSFSTNNFTTLQKSIYPETEPFIVESGDKRIMVFLSDDGMKSSVNRTTLMYSIYNNATNTWGTPSPVHNDGTADFYPNICSDGSDIYVTWHKSNKVLMDSADMNDLLTVAEIYVAKFDAATNSFIDVTRLTNNSILDTQPKIAVSNGKAFVAWVSNTDNNIFGTNKQNIIMVSESEVGGTWSTPRILINNSNAIINMEVDYFNGEPVVTYIVDNDNDMSTINDRDLLAVNLNGISKTIVNNKFISNIKFTNILGEKAFSWYQNNNISYTTKSDFTDIKTVFNEAKEGLYDNYKVISNNKGDTSILYASSREGVGGIYGFLYDEESARWSESVKILDTGDYVRFFDGVFDENDNLYLVFNKAKIEIADNELFEENDLCAATIIPQCDIAVSNIAYLPYDVKPNTQLPLVFDINNKGQEKVSGLTVKVISGTKTIDTVSVGQTIFPGETITVETEFMLPSVIAEQTEFKILVEPKNQIDTDMEDNVGVITVGYTDLTLHIDDYYYCGDNLLSMLSFENISDYNTTARLLVRQDSIDGLIMKSIDLGEIEANSKLTALINVDTTMYEHKQNAKEVMCFEIVSDKAELFTGNNSDFIVLDALLNGNNEVNSLRLDYRNQQLIIPTNNNSLFFLGVEDKKGNVKTYELFEAGTSNTVIPLANFATTKEWKLKLYGDMDIKPINITLVAGSKKLKAVYLPTETMVEKRLKCTDNGKEIDLSQLEYRTAGSRWHDATTLTINQLDAYAVYGTTLILRIKAVEDVNPYSSEVKLKIPKLTNAPKATIDYIKQTIKFPAGTEYRTSHSGMWKACPTTKVNISSITDVDITNLYLEVRKAAVNGKAASKIGIIDNASQKAGISTSPAYVIDYQNQQLILDTKSNTLFYIGASDKKGEVKSYELFEASGTTTKIPLANFATTKEWKLKLYGNVDNAPVDITLLGGSKKIKAVYKPVETTVEKRIGITDNGKVVEFSKLEYRTTGSQWLDASTLTIEQLEAYAVYGATLIFRIKAVEDECPYSSETKMKIPKRANAPKVTINYSKLTIKFPANTEYRTQHSEEWIPAPAKAVNINTITNIATKDLYLEVRKSAVKGKTASKIGSMTVGLQEDAPSISETSGVILITNEKSDGVTTGVKLKNTSTEKDIEYAIVSKDANVSSIDTMTQKWKKLTKGTEISLKKNESDGKAIIVRYSAVTTKNVAQKFASKIAKSNEIVWVK